MASEFDDGFLRIFLCSETDAAVVAGSGSGCEKNSLGCGLDFFGDFLEDDINVGSGVSWTGATCTGSADEPENDGFFNILGEVDKSGLFEGLLESPFGDFEDIFEDAFEEYFDDAFDCTFGSDGEDRSFSVD
eukprot:5805904-Ditylum_brightwellii.AAC.1